MKNAIEKLKSISLLELYTGNRVDSIVEDVTLNSVRKSIDTIKKKLISTWKRKGGYENFGERESRMLRDKYKYNPYGTQEERAIAALINDFEEWAMSYEGTDESLTETSTGDYEVVYYLQVGQHGAAGRYSTFEQACKAASAVYRRDKQNGELGEDVQYIGVESNDKNAIFYITDWYKNYVNDPKMYKDDSAREEFNKAAEEYLQTGSPAFFEYSNSDTVGESLNETPDEVMLVDRGLETFEEGGFVGVRDIQSGDVVVPTEYDFISDTFNLGSGILMGEKNGSRVKIDLYSYMNNDDTEGGIQMDNVQEHIKSLYNRSKTVYTKGGGNLLNESISTKKVVTKSNILAEIQSVIQKHVDSKKSFMEIGNSLRNYGLEYTFVNVPLPMYEVKVDGAKYGIVHKEYVDSPDVVIGNVAIGKL